jgi:hypothetical protein
LWTIWNSWCGSDSIWGLGTSVLNGVILCDNIRYEWNVVFQITIFGYQTINIVINHNC